MAGWALSNFFRCYIAVFLTTSALIAAGFAYNTLSHSHAIPLSPINWVITAPYGLVLAATACFLLYKRKWLELGAMCLIIFIWGWNIKFHDKQGVFDLQASVVIYSAQFVIIVALHCASMLIGRASKPLCLMSCFSAAMAIFGVIIAKSTGVWMINSADHFWWRACSNFIFLALPASSWILAYAPKTTSYQYSAEAQEDVGQLSKAA